MDRNTIQNNESAAPRNSDGNNDSENDFQRLIEKPDSTAISVRKDFLFISVFILIIIAAYFSPFSGYIENFSEFCRRINHMGVAAPLVFTLGVCALVCMGVPRLFLCPLGGMAFGFFLGLIYCVLGTLLGYYIIFLFIRWGGRNFVLRHGPKLGRFAKALEHGGIPAVILARQIPVHGMVINLILGLSPVRHRDFLIGTLIGLFPEAIPCTLVGSGASQGSFMKSMVYIIFALLAIVVLWLGMKLFRKRKIIINN